MTASRGVGALKPVLGPAAYLAGAVRAGLWGRPAPCRVRCDGRDLYAGDAWQVMVACSGAFGGGSRIEEADPGDGLLDVVVLAGGGRLRLVRHAYGLRRGRITDQPAVRAVRAARVELGLPPGAVLNADGDLVTSGAPLHVEPAAFHLVVG